MSRVFWDTMLLIYLFDEHPKFGDIARSLLARSFRRDDQLLTSYLALGEALVGMPHGGEKAKTAVSTLEEIGFQFLPFDARCVAPFRRIRNDFGLRGPDAMHLACAASGEVDLFLTGDKQLLKQGLHIPGIHFVVGFENAPL